MTSDLPFEYQEIIDRIEQLEKILRIDNDSEPPSHQNIEKALESLSDDEELSISNLTEIVVEANAYLRMATHALKYANHNIPRDDWVEVIGLLTGKVINSETPLEQILVKEYWPVTHGNAVSVNILDAEPVMDILKKKNQDEFIIGWAHSHPSYTPYLSEDDVNTQARYQALWSSSIAIVIDPSMISKKNYGFKVFRNADSRTYYELDYVVSGMDTEAAYSALQIIIENMV